LPPVGEDRGFFAAPPFRKEVFRWLRSALSAAVRNLSPATQQSYLNAISKFSRYFSRSPDRLGLEDVHAFHVHLVATGISWPALNQITQRLARRLPFSLRGGWLEQAGDGAHLEAHIRDPSLGERGGLSNAKAAEGGGQKKIHFFGGQ
jgi:hypothetical protein